MVLQTLIVAPGYIYGKPATMSFPPEVLMPLRILGAVLFYWTIVLIFDRKSVQNFRPTRVQWKQIALLALLGTVLNQITFMLGLRYTTPTHSVLIFATVPLMVMILSVFVLKSERMTLPKALGVGLALTGVSTIILLSGKETGGSVLKGDLITLLSVMCWSVYLSFSRDLLRQFPSLIFITVLMTVGAMWVLPFSVLNVFTYDYSNLTGEAWFGYFYLTIGSSALSYLLLIYAMHGLNASQTAIYINAQPLVTAFISFQIGTDRPTIPILAGGMLTVIGIYVLNRSRR